MKRELDAVSTWLEALKAKLGRAEDAMQAAGRSARLQGLTRKWWEAYLTYHCARIDSEETNHVPCHECGGFGTVFVPPSYLNIHNGTPEAVDIPCEDCDGTGQLPCVFCGESAAVTHNADFDALCAKCAEEYR